MLVPESEAALAEMVQREPLEICGRGSKRALGRPVRAAPLSLAAFEGIKLYEPDELVLTVAAATPLAEINQRLIAHGQYLAFDPPDFSALLSRHGGNGLGLDSLEGGSLGGAIACGLSGPGRLKYGGVRDHVLGMTGVSGRGEIFKAGGRVVKNVTGFDLAKLMVGAYGTLAVLTQITLKILPRPETQMTLRLSHLSEHEAIAALTQALQLMPEISAAAHLVSEKPESLLRFDTVTAAQEKLLEKAQRLLADFAPADVLSPTEAEGLWANIRDVQLLPQQPDRLVWRLLVPPANSAQVMARLLAQLPPEAEPFYYYDWGGGLIWLSLKLREDAYAGIIRAQLGPGQAMIFSAPKTIRRSVSVFQPQAPGLAKLTAQVKASFDPQAHLNPQRLHEGG